MARSMWWSALTLVVVLSACGRQAPPDEPVRAVKLMKVNPAGQAGELEYAGDIRARTESRLGFRVGGQLVQRTVDVGQTVKAGQVLALLDPRDYQAASRAAEAQVAAARTQRDLAAADFKRFQALQAQGFISGAELERREATLKAAQATLDQAEAQARVQGNQAGYTQLVADADGVIVGVDAEPGQVVAAGAPVVRLARQGPREAVVAVPEQMVASVRPGMPAGVRLWGAGVESAPVWRGTVREVAASADPLTRTFGVRVALPPQAVAPLGASATVYLSSLHSSQSGVVQAVRVPTTALWQQGQRSAVWVFDAQAGAVRARPVELAGLEGEHAVVTQGLQPGDEVVVAGAHVLSEGQRVVRYVGKTSDRAVLERAP